MASVRLQDAIDATHRRAKITEKTRTPRTTLQTRHSGSRKSLAAFRRPQTLQTQPLASRAAFNSSIDLRSRRRRMPGSHSIDNGGRTAGIDGSFSRDGGL